MDAQNYPVNLTRDLFLSVGNKSSAARLCRFYREPVDAVFIDFDYTATSICGLQSWSYVQENPTINAETKSFLKKCYAEHMPVEMSSTATHSEKLENARKWWSKTLPAVSSDIKTVGTLNNVLRSASSTETGGIVLKPFFTTFLSSLKEHGIPCVIFSAGIGDVVRKVLMDADPDAFGVHIVSNFMLFSSVDDAGLVQHKYAHHCTGDDAPFFTWSHPMITSANKNVKTLIDYVSNAKERTSLDDDDEMEDSALVNIVTSARNVLLIGDVSSDANMCDGVHTDTNVVKVCYYTPNYETDKTNDKNNVHESEKWSFLFGDEHYGVFPKRLRRFDDFTVKKEDHSKNNVVIREFLVRKDDIEEGDIDDDLIDKIQHFDIVLLNDTRSSFKPIHAMVFGFKHGDDKRSKNIASKDTDADETLFDLAYGDHSDMFDLTSISGYARAGKDTFHKILSDRTPCTQIAYADKLRSLAHVLNPRIFVGYDRPITSPMHYKEPMYNRYNDLISVYGYEKAKTIFPDVRRFLIALGHGCRTVIDKDCWLNWAFDQHKPLFDIVTLDDAEKHDNDDISHHVWLAYKFYRQLCLDFHEDLERKKTPYTDVDDETFFKNFALLTIKHFLKPSHIELIANPHFAIQDLQAVEIQIEVLDESSEKANIKPKYSNAVFIRLLREECVNHLCASEESPTTRRAIQMINVLPRNVTDARYHNERQRAYGMDGQIIYVYVPRNKPASPTEYDSMKKSYYHAIIKNDSFSADGSMVGYEKTVQHMMAFSMCYRSLFPEYPLFSLCCGSFRLEP